MSAAENFGFSLGIVGIIAVITAPIAAYITHVIWWINLAMDEGLDTLGEAVLAILGTIVPPIGMIHGIILWF